MFKNILLFTTLMCISLIISGCSKKFTFESDELKNDINKVEILFYSSPSDSELLVTIEEKNDLEDFINEFSKIKLTITYGAPGNIDGYCIKLIYNNNNYYLITNNHLEFRDENNKLIKENRIKSDVNQFEDLINKFAS